MRGVLVLAAAAAATAGAAYYLNRRPAEAVPPPPEVPAALADHAVVELLTARRRAVLADPPNGTAWGELGMAFNAHERQAEAAACYRVATRLAPDDARWPYHLAVVRREAEPAEAIGLLRECLARPAPSAAHRTAAELTLADLLADNGGADEAAATYERIFQADPRDPWAAYRAGMAAADRGDTAGALRRLTTLARNEHAQKKASAAIAAIHRRNGRAKEAEAFEYASSILPPDQPWRNPFVEEVAALQVGSHVLIDAVTRYEAAGDSPRAIATARKLADLYPSARTQLLLGRALVNAREYEEAVPVLDDTLRADPGMVMAHASVGEAQLGLAERAEAAGRPADARAAYEKAAAASGRAVELKPDYAPGHLALAKALAKLGRVADAERAARAAVALRPEEWEVYVGLADVLLAAGRKAEAVAAAEQAVRVAHPSEPRPRQALERVKGGG